MLAVECTIVGINTVFKAATLKGMSYYVFIVYSYAISSRASSLNNLYILENLPACTNWIWQVRFLAKMSGLLGIEYSSPTLASVISNLTPAFTFMLAIFFRFLSFWNFHVNKILKS
ncbi:WAT1-related protein At5g40240-like [Actinidia eriantha]|uniref:WAT1-related protein At5g40240-like n=1 Tax=Actinidia eriantha TaxID=165200 RepID=UPI00258AB4A5|nr:WAT1-related protein At5g40240-like [Actinidia eriantha]